MARRTVISSTFSLLLLIPFGSKGTWQKVFLGLEDSGKMRKVRRGREENESGSERYDRMQEAMDKGETEWRFH